MSGDHPDTYSLHWLKSTDQMRRDQNDDDEATEGGACGIAILITKKITGYVVVNRSKKTRGLDKSGFDYWIGPDSRSDLFINNSARLEVSGIRNGNDSTIQGRTKKKIKQVSVSDGLRLPAYVVIVEFGKPTVNVVVRK